MVDIVIGAAIPPLHNNPDRRDRRQKRAPQQNTIKDRRKNKEDRRVEIRSGVIVTLSQHPERRRGKDRRKTGS